MAEQDVFERRLRAALLRHVGDGPPDFDALGFARAVAAREPRHRGPGAALGWRGITVPRLAWVVLLLALLLAALVGGMLIAGSRPGPRLPAVVAPVVPAFECPSGSNPDQPGPVDQIRPPAAYTTPMAFDRRAGRIVALVTLEGEHSQTWTFDVCTNTWTRMADSPVSAGSDPLVYDAGSDLTITIDAETRRVWAYDLTADAWRARGLAPLTSLTGGRPSLVYDLTSGHVIRTSQAGTGDPDLWTYAVDTDTWTASSAGGFSSDSLLAFDSSADRLVSYYLVPEGQGTARTRLFDLRQGAWTDSAHVAPPMNFGWFPTGNEITYDEAAHRTIIFSAGRMIAYDAAADHWTEVFAGAPAADSGVCPGSLCRMQPTTIYDPVNERLVVHGGSYRDPSRIAADPENQWVQDDSVITFDLATRTWSVLVEATRMQSPPG
ncbi:MAG: Kelch repeat-containing protein [Candidatus Limnocylindrales bacterium]